MLLHCQGAARLSASEARSGCPPSRTGVAVAVHFTTAAPSPLALAFTTHSSHGVYLTAASPHIFSAPLPLATPARPQWKADFAGSRHVEGSTPEAFAANMARIRAHNADTTASWKAGVNAFTGMTREAFAKMTRGYHAGKKAGADATARVPHDSSRDVAVEALPASLDWRTQGVVTPVKDQGQCGEWVRWLRARVGGDCRAYGGYRFASVSFKNTSLCPIRPCVISSNLALSRPPHAPAFAVVQAAAGRSPRLRRWSLTCA